MIGATIGPYRILRELGHGGMGTVLLAEDTRLGRHVALKTVGGAGSGTPGSRAQLLDEARAAAALTHPSIAAVHDVIEHDGSIAIVFELVDGETLAARIAKGPLPQDLAVRVGVQIADALAVAHGARVLHRDLKPANIMLAPGDVVKILDFGIARFRPEGREATGQADEGFMGTPGYVPPEQWTGKAVDERADLYALGVVLFEMLTGKRPFPEREAFTLALASIDRIALRVSSLRPDVSPALDKLVARLLAADPALRPPRARVVADELRELLAPPPPPLPLPWKTWAATAVLGLAVVGGAAWWWTRPVRLDVRNPVIAVLPLANNTGDAASDYLGAGVADSLATSLAELPTVTVLPRAAVEEVRTRRKTPGEVAGDLGATLVVDGALTADGDQLRLTLALLRPDGSTAWQEEVEGARDDVFGMQARMAEALGAALRLEMSPETRARLNTPPTANVEALDAYWRGRAALERRDTPGNLPRAVNAFNEAVRLDPRFVGAHAALGEAHAATYSATRDPKAIESAAQATRTAVSLAPDDPAVRVALGTILVVNGRNAEAVQELQRGLVLRPSQDDARRVLGNALAALGRIDEALAEWRKAIELRPTNWQVFSDMGRALFGAARYPDAQAALERLVALQPDNQFGHQQLGTIHHMQGRLDLALKSYQRANAIRPSPYLMANIGAVHHTEGRFDEAIAAYRHAIELAPNLAYPHRNLGDTLLRVGRQAEARAAYARALELAEAELAVSPSNSRLQATAAVYAQKAGVAAVASRHLAAALAKAPSDVEVCYRAAVVHALAGRGQTAIDLLERALALGWPPADAAADDDFRSLRGDARYSALIGQQPTTGRQ